MSYWPLDAGAGVPSPELVAAWLQLGVLDATSVPLWTAHWIAAGHDGEALAELAGLSGRDPHEVRDLLPAALAECAVAAPDPVDAERAAAALAFDAIARLHLDGRASAHAVVRAVVEIVEPSFSESATGFPLGELYLLDDEWGAGWGRTEAQLRDEVWNASLRQLDS